MKNSTIKVELLAHYGSDLDVANAARVSFAKESDWDRYNPFYCNKECLFDSETNHALVLSDKDQKLINYLAKHQHWSPFAHNSLRFRIKAPVFCARQLVKHQVGGVWNEVSRRYVDDEPEFYFPEVWRGKPVNAKQGSSGVAEDTEIAYRGHLVSSVEIVKQCLKWYETNIACGMAPEQARMILPQNTMTEWWWTGSLMFFARVCKQRLDPHSQQETREVAQMIADTVPQEFQHSWKALMQ